MLFLRIAIRPIESDETFEKCFPLSAGFKIKA